MRYILYSSKKTLVSLESEIEYIRNIIDLQALRNTKENYVRFTVDGDGCDVNIAPLLFVPFIENAFKYAQSAEMFPVISIAIVCTNKTMRFTCSNYYNIDKHHHSEDSGGIGLANVKRRLQLLYPQKHCLHIQDKNNIFEVELELILS